MATPLASTITEDRITAAQSPVRIFFRKFWRVLMNATMFLYAITAIYPILWMIYSSMKTEEEFARNIFSLPSSINFNNFVTILTGGAFFRALFNSVFASVISIVFIVCFAFMIGYVLARFEFKGRRFIYVFFLFGMMVPVYALLVPIFLEFKLIGMYNNQFSIILPMIAFELSGAIFLFESYIRSIPTEIEEAAFIDGASLNTILLRVIFPICMPIVVTVLILTFLWTWNAFAFPLVLLRSQELKTIPLWLNTFQGERSTNYTAMMSALVLASLPVIAVYLAFREKIMQGMVAGAIKG